MMDARRPTACRAPSTFRTSLRIKTLLMPTTSDAKTVPIALGADAAPPRRALSVPNALAILLSPPYLGASSSLNTIVKKA